MVEYSPLSNRSSLSYYYLFQGFSKLLSHFPQNGIINFETITHTHNKRQEKFCSENESIFPEGYAPRIVHVLAALGEIFLVLQFGKRFVGMKFLLKQSPNKFNFTAGERCKKWKLVAFKGNDFAV